MPNDEMTAEPTGAIDGQADEGFDGSQTTQAAPGDGQDGQSAESGADGTSDGAPQDGTDDQDTFFDPSEIPDDLKPAYKQMQGAFTKRMQELSANRQKIAAYDQFVANPMQVLQQLAQQYGLTISQPGQQSANPQWQGQQQPQQDWEPESWDDVLKVAEQRALNTVMQQLSPVLSEVKNIKQSKIESDLNNIDPMWREYEDQMMQNLAAHPSLATNPAALYRISVPDEVIKSRAYKQALNRLQSKAQSGKVSGASTNKKAPEDLGEANSFAEAVEIAKRKLAAQGISPGK